MKTMNWYIPNMEFLGLVHENPSIEGWKNVGEYFSPIFAKGDTTRKAARFGPWKLQGIVGWKNWLIKGHL